jgi:methionyl-tRNA synthetase
MLKGSGYNLPDAVVASGMVTVGGNKLSKSRGYVIWVSEDYLDNDLDPDYLRYYVVSYTSQTKDLDFTWESFNDKVNNELVNTFGNFLYRALYFAKQNFNGVPQGKASDAVQQRIQKTVEAVIDGLNEYELKKVADEVMALAAYGNEYFQSNKPWELIKKDKTKCQEVIINSLTLAKAIAVLIEPIMPSVAEKVWHQFGMSSNIHEIELGEALKPLKEGSKLGDVIPVIVKIDEDLLARLRDVTSNRIEAALAADHAEPKKKMISFEDFKKMDIRAGKIIECTRIPRTDKLLKLQVDIGTEVRTIITGLGHLYPPEKLKGMTALFLVNLESKKIGGFESKGMILAVEKVDQPGYWVPVAIEGVPPGSKAA